MRRVGNFLKMPLKGVRQTLRSLKSVICVERRFNPIDRCSSVFRKPTRLFRSFRPSLKGFFPESSSCETQELRPKWSFVTDGVRDNNSATLCSFAEQLRSTSLSRLAKLRDLLEDGLVIFKMCCSSWSPTRASRVRREGSMNQPREGLGDSSGRM